MERLALFGLLLAGMGLSLAPTWLSGAAHAAIQDGEVRSGGIGLAREDWEDLHGAGEVGQSLVSYENGTYTVGFQDDTVAFIEVGWEDQGGMTADDARQTVEELIPDDAGEVELFAAPATATGPISLRLVRYQSRALVDAFATTTPVPTGSIVVIYQETAAADRFEPNVSRASIAIGTELP